MSKEEVAAALEEIGTLLQLQGENDFRVKAYTNGARLVSQYEGDFKQLVADGKLSTIRGIGDALSEKIQTLVKTGALPFLDDLRAKTPAGLLTLLKIPGLGPKKVKLLHDELQIDGIDQLKAACEDGRIEALKGFGAKTQSKILEGLAFLETVGKRVRIDQALPLGLSLLEVIRTMPGVIRAELCGSLRRRRETTKDIDIVASCKNAEPIMAAFVTLPGVLHVIGHGPTKSSIVIQTLVGSEKITLNADLRAVSDDQFPFAVLYLTGSKEHNIRLRQRALDRGLNLNEYALASADHSIACADEAEVYRALDLVSVPPELREDTGEIEAAETALPELIEYNDIRGVFHNHSTYSDGQATIETMVLRAKKLGWEYYGVGDHSQSLKMAGGLEPERVLKQWAEIDELNWKLKGIRILKGIECDILEDGTLDYDDELLAGFDYVVTSVHSFFQLSEEDQTARICKALRHPATTMLGHATGRLLLRRDGYKVDLDKVIATAAEFGKFIEINAQPSRLDLDWKWVKRAKAAGVKLVINPDAHHPDDLELVPYGVNVARRGWLTKQDVFNTRSLKAVLQALGKK